MAQVKITETVLRDSHQSLIATRMTTEEMLPILKTMDEVGYHSLEAWGGATFDSCMRFLNEDPWDRLRKIRDQVKNTKRVGRYILKRIIARRARNQFYIKAFSLKRHHKCNCVVNARVGINN